MSRTPVEWIELVLTRLARARDRVTERGLIAQFRQAQRFARWKTFR